MSFSLTLTARLIGLVIMNREQVPDLVTAQSSEKGVRKESISSFAPLRFTIKLVPCLCHRLYNACTVQTRAFCVAWQRQGLMYLKSMPQMHQSQGAKVGQCVELSSEGCDSPLSCALLFLSFVHTVHTHTHNQDIHTVRSCRLSKSKLLSFR